MTQMEKDAPINAILLVLNIVAAIIALAIL